MATKQELQDKVESQQAYINALEGHLEEAFECIDDAKRMLKSAMEALRLTGESMDLQARQAEINHELGVLTIEMLNGPEPDSHQEHDHASNAWVDEGTQ